MTVIDHTDKIRLLHLTRQEWIAVALEHELLSAEQQAEVAQSNAAATEEAWVVISEGERGELLLYALPNQEAALAVMEQLG